MAATNRMGKDELLEFLTKLLIGGDPLTFTKCLRGHRLYPRERESGICLRCAQENYAHVRDEAGVAVGAGG